MKPDTIFALSSGVGVAGVSVIRISGPEAGAALAALSGRALPEPRRAVVRTLRSPVDGTVLDRALCLWFAGEKSFSGEPVVEMHVHGGIGVVSGVLEALAGIAGLRQAQAGEFTRRAFEHGKLDLPRVEALGDLIAARTPAQVRQAMAADEGVLGRRVLEWRARLVAIRAELEAAIDFVEEDLPALAVTRLAKDAAVVVSEIEEALTTAARGQAIRSGYTVAILGQPNVGKSSLLNRLSGLEAAIVSTTAGTTRDVVQVEIALDGMLVRLCDTAGLREANDGIEREGVARALAVAERCDLALVVVDEDSGATGIDLPGDAPRLVVRNKADLLERIPTEQNGVVYLSATRGDGVGRLFDEMSAVLGGSGAAAEPGMVSRARQVDALERVAGALRGLDWDVSVELIADDLAGAVRALEDVVGVGSSEETLDAIFAEFCIGK